MRLKIVPLLIFLLLPVYSISAQAQGYPPQQQMQPPVDPMSSIAVDVNSLQRAVRELSTTLRQFVEKFEKAGGITLSEKQQRFIMGLELLVRSEQRVGLLQRASADLIEKQVQVKSRLTQIELDLRPANLDRSTMYEGAGSQSIEVRETRREKLAIEQRSLQQLLSQIDRSVAENEAALREAQSHVARLRRSLLPEIEKALSEATY
ncbi:MAG TPA: hypothetical protein VJV05_10090 [Pyrinomonadaceae bacterium]|nr:hypothetical protein [Pyrinomonadaceae bacterium]